VFGLVRQVDRLFAALVAQRRVGVVVQQRFDDSTVAVRRCQHQSGIALGVFFIDAGAGSQQPFDDLLVSTHGRERQRPVATVPCRVDVGAVPQ